MPSITQNRRKEIIEKLSKFPIEVKVLPSVDSIVNGEVTIDSIKHVSCYEGSDGYISIIPSQGVGYYTYLCSPTL